MENMEEIIEKQRCFFYSDISKNADFRIKNLKNLYKAIKDNEALIVAALKEDLNKSEFETYETEIGPVLSELRYFIKHLKKWSEVKKVKTPLMHFPSKSYIYKEPFGVVLIMSPWNYPFMLTFEPLIGAIGAGNCCIIKTSQYSAETSKIVAKIIKETFSSEYVTVIQGGRDVNNILLKYHFDYIFFTGSPAVGHIVMEAASKFLTPITLELGGKSPCIVDNSANIDTAAKRIIWGKLLNGGQTCVAPDYILVQEDIKYELIDKLKYYIIKFYGDNPVDNEYYPKIINKKHYNRLLGLLEGENIIFGGNTSESKNKISPVILDNVSWDSSVMNEEIFGPIIPVLTFNNFDELIPILRERECKTGKPLALYLFTSYKDHENKIMESVSFGGGCVNDTIIHLANSGIPFGGVGASGMGQYHGKYTFDTFSHDKSIIKKSNLIDINLRYPPFNKTSNSIRKILK